MPRTPRRPKKVRSPWRRRLFILLFFLCAVGLAFLVGVYVRVDRQVALVLDGRTTRDASAIYGDVVEISSARPILVEDLKQQLLRRRYREVTDRPSDPGEFFLSESEFQIVTRSFRAPDGRERPPLRFGGVCHDGAVQLSDKQGALLLEPAVLTTLGGTDVRASSYQSLSSMPRRVIDGVLAIEDQRFYAHTGIDPLGIARAMLANIRAMRFAQGGSTLTQQLAKNLLLTPEKTLMRKVQEALAALSLERRLSKDQILELYLNEVYLGQEGSVALHGMAQAADAFFGKRLDDLTTGEAAMLAGIIRAPSAYSPRRNIQRAIERRNLVLQRMHEEGRIDAEEFSLARNEKPAIATAKLGVRRAPHFVATLSTSLAEVIDMEAAALSGVSILTGLDLDMQLCAEQAVADGMKEIEKRSPRLARRKAELQASLVAVEPFSGKVRAWVGGKDFSLSQFDRVAQAKRQVGSTIKPFLYLTALDGQLNSYRVATTTSILPDRPMEISLVTHQTWNPENYDHEHRGDVTLRYALEHSLNMPAVYLAQKVGIPAMVQTAKRFHLAEDPPAVPSLALGALDTSLLSLTSAFAALANGGVYVAPRLALSVLNPDGSALYQSTLTEERIADERAVFVLTNILQGVVERGTARGVRGFGYNGVAAGKTGTSNDARDAWFVGFRPDLAAGAWVGFDDNSELGLTGGAAAVPIWAKFMSCVSKFQPEEKFIVPRGVHFVKIDATSGELAGPECPAQSVVTEVFVEGTEPRHACRQHGGVPGMRDIEYAPPEREASPERPRKRGFWESIFG